MTKWLCCARQLRFERCQRNNLLGPRAFNACERFDFYYLNNSAVVVLRGGLSKKSYRISRNHAVRS
jgi:hypothetical protein